MIYTDRVHLISDTSLEELHEFAERLGLRREWFQNHPRHPHYDLTTHRIRKKAYALGTKLIRPKDLAFIVRIAYLRGRYSTHDQAGSHTNSDCAEARSDQAANA